MSFFLSNPMSPTSYTPGPWKIVVKDCVLRNLKQVLWIYNEYGNVVVDPQMGIVAADLAECDANARLIAAAPELLEQCKILSAALAECYDWKAIEGEQIPPALAKVDELIARIGGA